MRSKLPSVGQGMSLGEGVCIMAATSKPEASRKRDRTHCGSGSLSGCGARRILVLGMILVLLLAGGCAPPGLSNDAGPGHRSQTLALSPQQELALGRQAYHEILSKARVVRGGPEVERVRRVGHRIEKAAAIEPLQREIN